MRTAAVVLALLSLCASRAHAAEPDADAIMQRNFMVTKVRTMRQSVTMTLVNSGGETRMREIELRKRLQANGVDNNLLIRFLYPPDIRGSGFLQLERSDGDDNLWIYLPALKKVRRLVAANRKDSFFGSDFSYGDILPPKVNLFRHRFLRTETVDGFECSVIESVPKEDELAEEIGYARKIAWIRSDNNLEARVEYYDSENRLYKTQVLRNHQEVDQANGKWMALFREMVNHQTDHKTILELDPPVVGLSLADSVFTVRSLKRF